MTNAFKHPLLCHSLSDIYSLIPPLSEFLRYLMNLNNLVRGSSIHIFTFFSPLRTQKAAHPELFLAGCGHMLIRAVGQRREVICATFPSKHSAASGRVSAPSCYGNPGGNFVLRGQGQNNQVVWITEMPAGPTEELAQIGNKVCCFKPPCGVVTPALASLSLFCKVHLLLNYILPMRKLRPGELRTLTRYCI